VEERLQELLDAWQDAFDQGREIGVADLCRNCPERAKEVQRRVDVLRKMGKLAQFSTVSLSSLNPDPPTSQDLSNRPTSVGVAGSRSLQQLLKLFSPPKATGELGRLGDYAILSLLGEGGMGAVFVAEDPMLQRRVALKVMRPEVAANHTARERFLREAQSAAKLQNDHIVPIFQVGQEKATGMWFITMPLLRGETLDQRIRRPPALMVAEIMKVGREVAEGLTAAHAMNLIHRDIKPANLWLESRPMDKDTRWQGTHARASAVVPVLPSADFRVKILDFGLARPTVAAEEMTGSGAFLGTPGFMSPEQIDSLTLDGRTDLFSLGCVLYRLATGQPAFQGATLTALLRATAEQEPPWPHTMNTAVPLAFSQLIMRLLQKKPDARYRSSQELLAAFEILKILSNLTLPPISH
jgi:serine/threonine protein kinase